MKIFSLFLIVCSLSQAAISEDCKPSKFNIPGAQYPCVYPDHRVAFRIAAAPAAQKVEVRVVGNGGHVMTKGDDGLWTVTTPPLIIGYHFYTVVVDGTRL